ncbi:HesA/MoeB/ThiF family protein [Sphingobacterium chuzhouense]|uniref:ThiF family adenylyltransferase n=1 Tax=Sphingobacterium chuzhouense TaxID=1742264 RepID=A0ABR7XPC3_9SPHI|nr:ThiF family adenylyltransferase [Sphingobacterium chuzhouense]MBD1421011.1 ThiF family adenylyltransferase [Sphingobacterium chuzhouense]
MKNPDTRYIRNRIYINDSQQETIKKTPILIAGCGIGSVIAECALRLGFENLTIIDGDTVEVSNLNRQNFTVEDISLPKVDSIKQRLGEINSHASVKTHKCFVTEENLQTLIQGHKIAVNALDFSSDIPLKFDKHCQDNGIPVLHPYNIGWGGLVAVITPDGTGLDTIARPGRKFNEIEFVEYALNHLSFWGKPQHWATEVLNSYITEDGSVPPPQLSIGSWLVASMCTSILFDISTRGAIKKFPDFYFSSIKDC